MDFRKGDRRSVRGESGGLSHGFNFPRPIELCEWRATADEERHYCFAVAL